MKSALKHIVLLIVLVAYGTAVFSGYFATMKKVLYSTSAPSSIAKTTSSSKPFAIHSLCTNKSQITSSNKIVVPDEGLLSIVQFPQFSEHITVHSVSLLPENLQPLSLPSKPRDPPVA